MCGRSADGTIQPGLLTKAYYLFFMTISFLFALFMVSLIDDAAAVLAVWCTGCSAHAPTGIMKPICSALPFAPEDILTQLTHASHMVLPW